MAALVLASGLLGAAPALADAKRGEELANKCCNGCHSVGSGQSARQGDAGPQFAELAKKGEGYLMTAINRPHDFMPKFPSLSARDKTDLVNYIRSVK